MCCFWGKKQPKNFQKNAHVYIEALVILNIIYSRCCGNCCVPPKRRQLIEETILGSLHSLSNDMHMHILLNIIFVVCFLGFLLISSCEVFPIFSTWLHQFQAKHPLKIMFPSKIKLISPMSSQAKISQWHPHMISDPWSKAMWKMAAWR